MFGSPAPQHDIRQAEQASRARYAEAEEKAARRAQLGVRRPALRERVRRWLTRRKPAKR